jgi:hypothetical protein
MVLNHISIKQQNQDCYTIDQGNVKVAAKLLILEISGDFRENNLLLFRLSGSRLDALRFSP